MPSRQALRNLVEIAAAFEARDSKYMLAYGTLLGAVRDGDFIESDNDTDLIVPIDEFDPRVIRDLYDKGFRLIRCFGMPDDGMELTLRRGDVRTDLFFLYPRRSGTYLSSYKWDFANRADGDGTAEWIDYEGPRFDYGWLNFKGHRFRAPLDADAFLVREYGDSWRTPNENWRYWVDPPNAKPRAGRLDFGESREAIAEFLLREAGMRVEANPYCTPPEVRMHKERWPAK